MLFDVGIEKGWLGACFFYGGARNCAKYGKLNITPKKDTFRVKRGGRKLFGLLA